MILRHRFGLCAVLLLVAAPIPSALAAPPPTEQSPAELPTDLAALERIVFDPILSEAQVQALLASLLQVDKREASRHQLAQRAQGRESAIVAFAAKQTDLKVREQCAWAVEQIEARYFRSPPADRLAALYREQAEDLLPAYFAAFRKNPLDARAITMLMAADPAVVDEWLQKHHDRLDRLRFVLLRGREQPEDEFFKTNIFNFSKDELKAVVSDVYPVRMHDEVRCKRILGHIAYAIFDPHQSERDANVKERGLSLFRQRIFAFCYRSDLGLTDRWAYVNVPGRSFYISWSKPEAVTVSKAYWTRTAIDPFECGLAPLVRLNLNKHAEYLWTQNAEPLPWWSKDYLPESYLAKIGLGSKPDGAEPPKVERSAELSADLLPSEWPAAKAAPAGSPTLVLLPPHIEADEVELMQPACDLLCDALAAYLNATGEVQVVDRKHLQRLFQEQQLQSEKKAPIAAFDAMVRLEFQMNELPPTLTLRLVDLTTGNPLETQTFDWPLAKDALPAMNATCIKGVVPLAQRKPAEQSRLRIRLLPPEYDLEQPRIRQLVQRLQNVYMAALQDSQKLELIQHLEAGSAQEEALLLCLGLAQHAGQREFAPQADVMLALRLSEQKVVGKSFEQTPLELAFRLHKAGADMAEWQSTVGLAGEYDTLLKNVWEKLSQQLGQIDPHSAAHTLESLHVRRQQAETELAAPLLPDLSEREQSLAKVRRAETALKLDPSFEKARVELLVARGRLVFATITPAMLGEIPRSAFFDVSDRFLADMATLETSPVPPNLDFANTLSLAYYAIQLSPLDNLSKTRDAKLDAADVRRLAAVRSMCNYALCDIRTARSVHRHFVSIIYRGMRLAGDSREARIAWLNHVTNRMEEMSLHETGKLDAFYLSGHFYEFNRAILRAAELFLEDQAQDEAIKTILKLEQLHAGSAKEDSEFWDDLLGVVAKIDNAELTRTVNSWRNSFDEPVRLIQPIVYNWLTNIHPGEEPAVPQVMVQKLNPGAFGYYSMIAVAADDKHAFVMYNTRSTVGWDHNHNFHTDNSEGRVIAMLKLDERGAPQGKLVYRRRRPEWEGLIEIPQPEGDNWLGSMSAQMRGGKLYLSTTRSGMLIYDPEKKSWQKYNSRSGLPTDSIYSFVFLDDKTLFCTGNISIHDSSDTGRMIHFTLDLSSGESKIIRLSEEGKKDQFEARMSCFWQHAGRWQAMGTKFFYRDLMSPSMPMEPVAHRPLQAVKLGDQFFCSSEHGLHEFSAEGKPLRAWSALRQMALQPGSAEFQLPRLADTPAGKYFLVAGGDMIFMPHVNESRMGICAYQPSTDRWLGPLCNQMEPSHLLGTATGVWIGGRDGMCYVSCQDFLATAEQSGRALSLDSFAQRKRDVLQLAKTTDERACLAIQAQDWKSAAEALKESLIATPDDAGKLLLAGVVHDRWGLNRPDEAIVYYQKLFAFRDPSTPREVQVLDLFNRNPKLGPMYPARHVAFTGLYWSMQCYLHKQEYNRVLELAEIFEREYSISLDSRALRDIRNWAETARQELLPKPDK